MLYQKYIKRFFDICISLLGLLVLSPVMLLVGLLVKKKIGGPVIFKQKRPGKDEKIFVLYKFRTMTDERDENGNLLPDELRMTKFGELMRSTSLDEIPELYNILKGDMSLIGPRPLLVEYLPLYTEKQRKRHSVKAGLSGWAQINGRNLLDWEDKFALDLEYVERISFLFDVQIFLLTIINVVSRSGITSAGSATTKAYEGEKELISMEEEELA